MNFIIGAVGANITLGVLQGVTSAASGVYSVCYISTWIHR